MGRVNIDDARIRNSRIGKGRYHESATFVPADNFVLTVDHPPLLFLNPAGAIDVLMPTSTAARQGLRFTVVNRGAGTITFKTDGDAAFTAAAVCTNTQTIELICTGSTTQAVGWVGYAAAATQTSP